MQKPDNKNPEQLYTKLASVRLGFGCSGLMTRLDRKASLNILQTAFDVGVRHFDTARMYGYGEAESALRPILSRHRSEVTITTKAGIMPPRSSRHLRAMKQLMRIALPADSPLRLPLRRIAATTYTKSAFDIESLEQSLSQSLMQLGTDYVDVLLLHDVTKEDLNAPRLFDFLSDLIASGRVLSVGIASSLEEANNCIESYPSISSIIQTQYSPHVNSLRSRMASTDVLFLHSVFGSSYKTLMAKIGSDASYANKIKKVFDLDPTDRNKFGRLFLSYVINTNDNAAVLFSTTDPKTIVKNVESVYSQEFSESILAKFRSTINEEY